jgi:hypothetical protein
MFVTSVHKFYPIKLLIIDTLNSATPTLMAQMQPDSSQPLFLFRYTRFTVLQLAKSYILAMNTRASVVRLTLRSIGWCSFVADVLPFPTYNRSTDGEFSLPELPSPMVWRSLRSMSDVESLPRMAKGLWRSRPVRNIFIQPVVTLMVLKDSTATQGNNESPNRNER